MSNRVSWSHCSLARSVALAMLIATLCGCSRSARQSLPDEAISSAPLPVTTGNYPVYGHAADFSWIAGRIAHSLKGGCTYVVFSTGPNSPWGGKLALDAPPDLLSAFPAGDLIVVLGDISRFPHGACGAIGYAVASLKEH